ncbi:MAG: hypothetical protein JWM80_1427 [Cyanobacteria bacterium RYN_339]|nr:hypothetical protein [Cyanobacteria bacterium RYN_339]
MLHTHSQGPDALPTRGDEDDDDDEPSSSMRAPQVDSGKSDRLNPPTEYKVLDLAGEINLEAKLNELGEEGWALVSTNPSFIFRRMKKSDEAKKKARVGFGIG